MNKKTTIATLSVLGLVLLFSFQNCGTELPDSLFSPSRSGDNDVYEVKVDQVAYMSCSEQQNVMNEQNMFFSFRVGAYGGNTGMRLSSQFLQTHRNKSKARLMDILTTEPVLGGSQIQFSMRQQSDLSRMFIGGNSSGGLEGVDFDYTFGLMGSEEMSASLLNSNDTFDGWLNYWSPAGVNRDAYFEGTLVFNESEAVANQVRNFLGTGGGILTTVFSDASKPENIRVPDYSIDKTKQSDIVPANVAFGRGLRMSFKQPNPLNWGHSGAPVVSMPKRVLSTVTEYNLLSPHVPVGTWTCPSQYQLRIVYNHPSHLVIGGTTVCTKNEDDPSSLSAADQERLRMIRRSLPASDWHVDLARNCVVPRRVAVGSCYGIDAGVKDTRSVNYNFTVACNPAIVDNNAAACPHFVSVCYKTQ